MSRTQIVTCTVVSRSHLGCARAMVRSLRRWHPDSRSYVLVIDEGDEPSVPAQDGLVRVRLADLGIPDSRAFCFQYTVFELCNAMKAPLLRHVLEDRGEAAALYLDGDIGVFGGLDGLWSDVLSHDVVLTPHFTRPLPPDGRIPSMGTFLTAGSYNAGVVGVRRAGDGPRFLEWWAGCVRHDCVVDSSSGRFVDQKYLDLVPSLFPDHKIVRHDGINVAHFNLHYRTLRRDAGRWWANDAPLLLFHFTQVDWMAGNFGGPVSRDFGPQLQNLRALVEEFRVDLEASDWIACSRVPYGFGTFDDGLAISPATRAEFRRRWVAGAAPGDPFVSAEWKAFERAGRLRSVPERFAQVLRRIRNRVHRLGRSRRRTP